jgi:hypothetical protein
MKMMMFMSRYMKKMDEGCVPLSLCVVRRNCYYTVFFVFEKKKKKKLKKVENRQEEEEETTFKLVEKVIPRVIMSTIPRRRRLITVPPLQALQSYKLFLLFFAVYTIRNCNGMIITNNVSKKTNHNHPISFLSNKNHNLKNHHHTSYAHTHHNQRPFQLQRLHASLGEYYGLTYEEPLFRPPAEWKSLILQVTIGCSWNKCTFCEMYQDKTFRMRPMQEIIQELDTIVNATEMGGGGGGTSSLSASHYVRDVFLADGDAMMLPTSHLESILDAINERFPSVRRVSSYCLPRNIKNKSIEDLKRLQSKGLSLVYVGCESGDDKVLASIQKGETLDTSLEALHKLEQAGIKRSVMILLGLGGKRFSRNHAIHSATLCNRARPEYLSMLTTSFPRGKERIQLGYRNDVQNDGGSSEKNIVSEFEELNPREILSELELFLYSIDLPYDGKTIFRADHASNYLVLKGRLGRDKDKLIQQVRDVLDAPPEDDAYNLRPEWSRGL